MLGSRAARMHTAVPAPGANRWTGAAEACPPAAAEASPAAALLALLALLDDKWPYRHLCLDT